MTSSSSFVDQFDAYSIFPNRSSVQLGKMANSFRENAYSTSKSLQEEPWALPALKSSLLIELNVLKEVIDNEEIQRIVKNTLNQRLTDLLNLVNKLSVTATGPEILERINELTNEINDLNKVLGREQQEVISLNVANQKLLAEIDSLKLQNENLGDSKSTLEAQLKNQGDKLEKCIDREKVCLKEIDRMMLIIEGKELEETSLTTQQKNEALEKVKEDLKKKQKEDAKKRKDGEIEAYNTNKRLRDNEVATKKQNADQYLSLNPNSPKEVKDLFDKTAKEIRVMANTIREAKKTYEFQETIDLAENEATEREQTAKQLEQKSKKIEVPPTLPPLPPAVPPTVTPPAVPPAVPPTGKMNPETRQGDILQAWELLLKPGAKADPETTRKRFRLRTTGIFLRTFTEPFADVRGDLSAELLPGKKVKGELQGTWKDDLFNQVKVILIPLLEEFSRKTQDDERMLVKGHEILVERPLVKVFQGFVGGFETLLKEPSAARFNQILGETSKGKSILTDLFLLFVALERIYQGTDNPEISDDTKFSDALWDDLTDLAGGGYVKPAPIDTNILSSAISEL